MKQIVAALLTICLAVGAQAQGPKGDEWQDPQALGQGKQASAALLMPADKAYVRCLDGRWVFSWVNHPDKRPLASLSALSPQISALTDSIDVPGNTTASRYTSIRRSSSGIRSSPTTGAEA